MENVVEPEKMNLPELLIKLDLIKIFVKAVKEDGLGF